MKTNLNRCWRTIATTILGLWMLAQFSGATAARAYFDGTMQSNGSICLVTGNIVTVLQTYTGYYTDAAVAIPATGDIAYIHAIAVNLSPCHIDAPGFDFFLPDGASFVTDPNYPINCFRGAVGGATYESVTNDSNGGCSQTPGVGSNGGASFGWSKIAGGWYLEIQVPVRWNKKLLGLAGPVSHKLRIATSSAYGTIVAEQAVTTFYNASFANPQSSNITTNSARLDYDINSYYATGQLYYDYGTSTAFGSSVSVGTIPNTGISFNTNVDLTGLQANTTYYWQARFISSSGTFTSSTQTFKTQPIAVTNFALTVSKTGNGSIGSAPTGINCGATCTANFASGTTVTLTPTAASGSVFAGWSGDCTGTGSTCTITMNAAKNVSATFNNSAPIKGSLNITLAGLPSGSSATLNLTRPDGVTQAQTLATGTAINLSDVDPGLYTVVAPNITVGTTTYSAATKTGTVPTNGGSATINIVYAAVAPQQFSLSVTNPGGGTITSTPAGINCSTTCTTSFAAGTSVTLTATPTPGTFYVFNLWQGECDGAGPSCTIIMNGNKNTSVDFIENIPPTSFTLNVGGLPAGTNANVVITNPSGSNSLEVITAGSGKTYPDPSIGSYTFTPQNVVVGSTTYSAAAQSTSLAVGDTKTITIRYASTSAIQHALTVSKTGAGTISSAPAAIDCGTTCTADFSENTILSLNATPATGSTFTSWGGACTGAGTCTVTMNAAKTVTATFTTSTTNASLNISKNMGLAATSTTQKASSNNLALAFNAALGTSAGTLQSVTLNATGTGNDAQDMTNIKLHLDANSNGILDAGDTVLAQGKFASNDGQTTLTLNTPQSLAANSNTKFLLTADFNSSLASTLGTIAFGSASLLLLGFGRSRKFAIALAALGLATALTACPQTPPPAQQTLTYQISLTSLNAKDAGGASINASGLAIAGTVISVAK